jgi:hypothetical protein
MAVGIGQRCVVRIKITDVELRKARGIVATVESPQYVAHCQEVAFDEVSGLVYVAVDVNSAGSYSMWLEVRFAKEVVYTPAFVFAEVEGDAKPCDVPYVVDVEVQGESVSVTPPKIDVDAVTREEFEQLSKDVANKVDKVAGKGLSTNDYTDAEKAKVAEIDGLKQSIGGKANTNGNYPNMTVGKAQGVVGISQVQEALTLTTKSNGNIVIGNIVGQSKEFMPATPSGDPMHYAYEAAGATWNASTGYWEFNELTNITTSEMRAIFNEAYLLTTEGLLTAWFNGSTQRTNICLCRWQARAAINTFGNCVNIEVATLGRQGYKASPTNLNYAFYPCKKLKKIITIIDCNNCTSFTAAFNGCYMLEKVRLEKLNKSISFADSPNLSTESILYMIENATATTAITITLHEDAYMSALESNDIIHALEIKEKVSIASA